MRSSSGGSSEKCSMEVVCDRSWSDLHVTELSGARFCEQCEKLVFYARNQAEIKVAAERNLCVYISPGRNLESSLKVLHITRQRIRRAEAQTLLSMKKGLMGHVVKRSLGP